MRNTTPLILLSLLLATGCSSDDPIDDGGDGTGSGDGGGSDDGDDGGPECFTDEECGPGLICEAEECVDGDRNNSVDEAESMLWDSDITGTINPAGDLDYYSFAAAGGEFIRLDSIVDEDAGQDLVLVVRDTLGKVLAVGDEYPSGGNVSTYDAMIYAYIPEAGTYTVSVEDVGTYYSGGTPNGGLDYSYILSLSETDRHTAETDSFEDPSYVMATSAANTFYPVGVVIDEPGDTDHIQLSFPYDDGTIVIYGMDDLGGSEAQPSVRLLNSEGEAMSSHDSLYDGSVLFHPDMDAGSYVLEVGDALGQGSAQHWYYLFAMIGEEASSYPDEVEDNGIQAMANVLAMTEHENSGGNLFAKATIEGFSDGPDDEDWFSFDAPYGETWVVMCMNSSIWGSGVTPSIDLFDGVGELLASSEGDASASPNANIENHPVSEGPHFVRVRAPADATTGPDQWWRMNLFAASFEVSTYADGGYSCP
jgi:hypothetical protein